MEEVGRRERKKQRTRQQILRAGLELILAQGFAETTVAQIAAAADVAQSTFFLHFSSKEQLVLAGHDMGARSIVAMLLAPRDGPLVDVLRAGTTEGLRPSEWDAELWELRAQVIASDPGLAGLERIRWAEVVRPHLIAAFAAELGVDASAPEPHLLAALAIGGLSESARLDAAPDREAARARYFGRLFDALEAAVARCRA
jgi:AcrR family transcriptional regulator